MTSPRRLSSEALATFTLVFLGTGACAANAAMDGRLGAVGVGLAFGLAVFAGATLFGPSSGAHMNPAVTAALWRAGRFSGRDVGPYLLAQSLGALAASALLLRSFGARGGDLGVTHPVIGAGPTFALEAAMTFLLVAVVLRSPARVAPAAAGAVVAVEAILAGPLTGASMNPVRSLAPALVSGRLGGAWIYVVAPLLGAFAASFSARTGAPAVP